LVHVAIAVCAGILVDRHWPLAVSVWWAVAVATWVGWLILWRRRWERTSAILVLLAGGATAGSWHHCCWYLFAEDDLGNFAEEDVQPVAIECVAMESGRLVPAAKFDPLCVLPQREHTRMQVAVQSVRDGAQWRAASGVADLRVDGLLTGIRAGDRLRVFARLVTPAVAMNPGQFDYAQYLRADRKRAVLRAEYVEAISVVEPGGWSLARLVDAAKQYGLGLLWRQIDPNRKGLAAAVLLGAREQLDAGVGEAYVETGTIHLLVISGFHVAMLGGAIWFLMRRLWASQWVAIVVVAGVTVFYATLVGMEPPVLRATILVLCTCLAVALGRQGSAPNALAAGAVICLVFNPTDLFNVGAQLSFLSVAGLVWLGGRRKPSRSSAATLAAMVDRSRHWTVRWAVSQGRGAVEMLWVGAVIWALILPLVMARFHLIAVVGALLTVILSVPVTVAMIAGLVFLVVGQIPYVGGLCGRICDGSLWLMEAGVRTARQMRWSHFWVPGPADWWLIGFYGALGLAVAYPSRVPPRRWCAAILGVWVTVGLACAEWHRPRASLDCTVLAVGHGCATVMELPSGQTLLYDVGQLNSPHSAARTVASYLWTRGIVHLDAVVLSHADVDHFNGLPELVEQFSVGVVYVPPLVWDEQGRSMAILREAIGRQGIEVREMRAGDRLDGGEDCVIESLHPPAGGVPESNNANSLVLGIGYAGKRILLPGDLESPGLEQLLEEEPWRCDVLMAPHHGSRRGQSPRLASWCQPKWIVISAGLRRDFPEIEALYATARGELLHTARCGAVTFHMDSGGLEVQRFRKEYRGD
jgi:competence protein ComEC